MSTRAVPSGAVFGIVVGLMAPRSRGWVRLASNDPNDPPRIHFGHLTDPEDLEAILDGIDEARRIARSDPVASIVTGAELSPGPKVPSGDRTALAAWALRSVSTFHHPVGTCAMGAETEPGRSLTSWLGPWHRRLDRCRRFDHADRPDWNTESSDDHGGRAHCGVASEFMT